jgi:hypothetical protein
VQKVVLNHNHTFVSPDKTHMIMSQCCLLQADKHVMKNIRGAIEPTGIYNFYEQWSGGDQDVNFLPVDCNNYLSRERKKYLEAEDAQTLVQYLKKKQIEDPPFFYSVQLDPEDVA